MDGDGEEPEPCHDGACKRVDKPVYVGNPAARTCIQENTDYALASRWNEGNQGKHMLSVWEDIRRVQTGEGRNCSKNRYTIWRNGL